MAANKKMNSNLSWWVEPIKMFVRLSAWIALPVVIGTFLGKWLDSRFHTGSRWFFILVGLAFIISIIGLVKNTIKEYKKIETQEVSKK